MKMARAAVSPTASSFTCHQGRPSWMSYVWLSVLMMASTPDEVLQMVPSIPNVRRPPFFSCAIFRI